MAATTATRLTTDELATLRWVAMPAPQRALHRRPRASAVSALRGRGLVAFRATDTPGTSRVVVTPRGQAAIA